MTDHRLTVSAAIFAVSMVSCASPRKVASTEKAETPPEKRAPVRLNGRGKITSISLTDLFTLQQSDQAIIFDARPRFFYNLGHIPGAISLPKDGSEAVIHERGDEIKAALTAKKTIVVYCTNFTCPDARTVAIHLSSFGYSSSTLADGWDGWKDTGLPTE